MPIKVDLKAALATFDEPWSPRIVGRYNVNKPSSRKAHGELSGTRTPTRTTSPRGGSSGGRADAGAATRSRCRPY
jgi:hypothetical protein